MKEIRNANIIFNKNGNGNTSTKITLPVPWIKEMNFNEDDKTAILEICENKIIIRKKERNMLLIKNENFERVGHKVDYELENGVLLYEIDWNGEIYRNGFDPINEKDTNKSYKPVYRFEIDNINLDELEENSDEWYRACEIIAFKEI